MRVAPYTTFGKTRMIPVLVYQNNKEIQSDVWDDTIWVETGECWYQLMSMGNKKVRVIQRTEWLRAKDIIKEDNAEIIYE